MPVPPQLVRLEPQTGTAFVLLGGARLRIVATESEQVADVALFARYDHADSFSPGRTMDYNERLIPQIGDVLYSNRSTPLARVVADTAGVHDLLLTPCSRVMFERRGQLNHPSCHENLSRALGTFGLGEDDVLATLNVFMDVRVEGNAINVYPPASRVDDYFELQAQTDLVVAMCACSSELTNNGRCKSVGYLIYP
ncbi:MAG: urea carboxylase-associated family protein [Candidatus Eremiobacteraeota bacterium]|nr:urea carboxylase-associated family protein [Candidatus Eremiobacteraeota bacterium]